MSCRYSNMLACWATAPVERPTFTKLCEELSDVLQDEAGHVSSPYFLFWQLLPDLVKK